LEPRREFNILHTSLLLGTEQPCIVICHLCQASPSELVSSVYINIFGNLLEMIACQ